MSSDYYFTKWKRVLNQLKSLLDIDLDYQESKAHDKTLCMTVQRLSGVMGGYMAVYNEAKDCLNHSLQVQKTRFIADVISTVTRRIIELKHQLGKLEKSNYQFITRGLSELKLTTDDVEFNDIPEKVTRSPEIEAVLADITKRVEEERMKLELEKENALSDLLENAKTEKWWEVNKTHEEKVGENEKELLNEEQLERKKMLSLILAQEKCRQTIKDMKQMKNKRERWEKELKGIAHPPARAEIRSRAVTLIQKFIRAYFDLKRKKQVECKRDEMLDIKMCKKQSRDQREKADKLSKQLVKTKFNYESQWKASKTVTKNKFLQYNSEEIQEDYRDEIRSWFQKWYDEVWYIYDIPKANQGGSTLILNGEVPEPAEWLMQNELYQEEMKANKKKNSLQLKEEKLAAQKEAQMVKRQEMMKRKQEEALLRKMMKNPNMHPGFIYPKSKETHKITLSIQNYNKNWGELDADGTKDVKEKYVEALDKVNVWAEIKQELRPIVDDVMRIEQKQLKKALKEEYEFYDEPMPAIMPQKFPKLPTKIESKLVITDAIADKMVDLTLNGYLKEYPRTKFEDFKGEPNFAGDDLRCKFIHALPFGGETRNVWWERCREVKLGLRNILLVGAKGSGKSVLVHAMATVNDALLFELEPTRLDMDTREEDLKELINSIAASARAAQPSVIYIKNVQRLFYRKAHPGECLNVELLRKYLIKKLIKKLHVTDKITIVGSCTEPWMTKSKKLLKQFPTVLLMPNATYTTTVLLLREWVLNNRMIPPDLDVSSLAYVLQGYSYGYLQNALDIFLSAERVIKIAAYGLRTQEIYDYILQDDEESKVEYEKYLKWYQENTHWGIVEKKHLDAQLEFQAVAKKYAEKMKKKKKMKMQSAASSLASSVASIR